MCNSQAITTLLHLQDVRCAVITVNRGGTSVLHKHMHALIGTHTHTTQKRNGNHPECEHTTDKHLVFAINAVSFPNCVAFESECPTETTLICRFGLFFCPIWFTVNIVSTSKKNNGSRISFVLRCYMKAISSSHTVHERETMNVNGGTVECEKIEQKISWKYSRTSKKEKRRTGRARHVFCTLSVFVRFVGSLAFDRVA